MGEYLEIDFILRRSVLDSVGEYIEIGFILRRGVCVNPGVGLAGRPRFWRQIEPVVLRTSYAGYLLYSQIYVEYKGGESYVIA